MTDSDKSQKSGWWGSTLSKLKSALSRTRSAVVDSVLEDETAGATHEGAPSTIPEEEPSQYAETEAVASATQAKAEAKEPRHIEDSPIAPSGVEEMPAEYGAEEEPRTGTEAAEPAAEPTTQPAAEPTTQLAAEPTTRLAAEPTTQLAAEPTAKRAAEPTAKPTTQRAAQPTTQKECVGAPPAGGVSKDAEPAHTPVDLRAGERPAGGIESAQAAHAAVLPQAATASVRRHAAPARAIDDDYIEHLEEKLIKADLGLKTAESVVLHLRKQAKSNNWTSHDVEGFLKNEFSSILKSSPSPKLSFQPNKLNLYLIVGVNGTGKTTSIGKLCWRFKSEGKKVLVAAADTFRAAAESQLEIWARRAGVDIVRLQDGSDPGAVVFQALQKAKAESYDVVVIDTAGRLHNKANLMAELKKIRGVIEKHGLGLPLESLLVLDASTGQNGLQQAKVFTEVCPLTGVILTKLDGTAKGGVVFAIASELKIPVKLIGLGEKIDDLRDFEPELFVEALFN
ncbi:MAG TPA: signal recognition particle-docking protein FtsY [Candidatus Obscuribacterales bacterium]